MSRDRADAARKVPLRCSSCAVCRHGFQFSARNRASQDRAKVLGIASRGGAHPCARSPFAGQGEAIVRGSNRFVWVVGLGLVIPAAGCHSSGGSSAAGGRGPSPLFGQAFVPSQSEPPVADGGGAQKTASRPGVADSDDDVNADGSSAAARGRARWLPGNDRTPPRNKALPVSARTDSMADDDSPDR